MPQYEKIADFLTGQLKALLANISKPCKSTC